MAEPNPAPSHVQNHVQPEPAPVKEAQPVVLFENVSLRFDGPPVLENVSFRVGSGETRILLGPAGVGKSVLLKLANGLLRPDSGRIFLFGEEITAMPEEELLRLRTSTGMVFQEGALFDSLTVRDNVGYQLMERHLPVAEIDQRVHEALRFVELEHTYGMLPASLSGGMRRRVAIARAIIDKPDLLLYDSPTGGLDPVTSTTIIELIIKERDVYRTPSLLVTHRLQDAFTMVSHRYDNAANQMVPLPQNQNNPNTSFLVLHQGKLIFDGSTDALVSSEDPFLKEFLA
ncbi:ABC transporter ATP-binding protein [Acidicapsa acidisoli]|uniref:ABC transporter ATP-binding protein n=1 Tax=Acidicapsa acidisoli TaxID=1615681 RepID=UPI0021DFEDBA|nr:ATP-binding cassette domain-containing protein [Acidicapsa acidisoli]